jgi:geranylgeranyl diphosphate synthase type I
MVEGKTAALISASAEIGAMAALNDDRLTSIYRKFGHKIGLAFQVQDDFLGIWGNSSLTGKSSQSDIATGKITLPIMYALSKGGEFAARWKAGPVSPSEVPAVVKLLEGEGADQFTRDQATRLLEEALESLRDAKPQGIAGEALENLALSLVNRQS